MNIESIAIKQMIIGSAPERENELNDLWAKYAPQFNLREDTNCFSMSIAFGTVIFDHKTMCQIWLLGFASEKAQETYSPFLFLPYLSEELINNDFEYSLLASEFKSLIDNVNNLLSLNNLDDFLWPEYIPLPYHGKPNDLSGSLVFDLVCIAGAFCFLHEIQHIKLPEDEINIGAYEAEMACDQFAIEYLLSEVDKYSLSSGYSSTIVKSKRAMGIALGIFVMMVITPKDNWQGTNSHPPIKDRIKALTDYVQNFVDDSFWIFLSSLTLALIKLYEIKIEPQTIESKKDTCLNLIKLLDRSSLSY